MRNGMAGMSHYAAAAPVVDDAEDAQRELQTALVEPFLIEGHVPAGGVELLLDLVLAGLLAAPHGLGKAGLYHLAQLLHVVYLHGALVAEESGFIDEAVRLAGDHDRLRAMGRAARAAVLKLRPEQVAAEFDALLAGLARQGDHDAALAA